MPISKFVSPDGALTFVVIQEDGDFTLGFEGAPWHTHGDIISSATGLPIDEAVAGFIDALLNDQSIIAIATVDGVVRDVWIPDLPLRPDPYKPENESIAFRLWGGTPCWIDEPPPTLPAPAR